MSSSGLLCAIVAGVSGLSILINPSGFSVVYSHAYANAGRRIMLLMMGSIVHIQCIFLTYKQFFV